MTGLSWEARSWIREAGVSTTSASSQRTHAVEGPSVVKRRALRACDMAERRARWFSILWRSCSSWEISGGSKSCRRMVMLAKRFSRGPDWVVVTADWRAAVAVLPSWVFGVMKPRAMRWWGYVRDRRFSQYSG